MRNPETQRRKLDRPLDSSLVENIPCQLAKRKTQAKPVQIESSKKCCSVTCRLVQMQISDSGQYGIVNEFTGTKSVQPRVQRT